MAGIGAFFAFATDAGMQSSLDNQAVNAYLDTAVSKFTPLKIPPLFQFLLK